MQVEINEQAADQRFDRFLRKYCKAHPEVKLSDIFSRVRKGLVKVNGKKTKENYRLQVGDVVTFADEVSLGEKNPRLLLSQKERKLERLDPHTLQQMTLQEDDYWIVFDKPAGVILHPSNKHWNDLSMDDYLIAASADHEL